MMDTVRRNILTTGVAATAMAAAPGVFAQQNAQGGHGEGEQAEERHPAD